MTQKALDGWGVLSRLVAIPSPTGSEALAVQFLQAEAQQAGFRIQHDHAGNFIAEAGHGPRLLLFVGHIDTVPGEIPVRVEGGELWGRGAVDAKGPLVAMLAAAHAHLDDPALTIRVVGAVDEEGHSAGAKALDRSRTPEWIVVGEPSGVDGITLGYKGILRARLRVQRPTLHGAHPGRNALDEFHDAWSRMRERGAFAEGFTHLGGRLDAIQSTHDGLIDTVEARLQVRLPPGQQPLEVAAWMRDVAQQHAGDFVVDEAMPAALSSSRTPLVAAFRTAIRSAGLQPHLKHKTGTADFNHLAQWFPGVPMVAYGPGDSHLDHTPQERIARGEFEAAVGVLRHVLAALPGHPA